MLHLGDITKINGADVPPVDIITGGSPCQDLSVAGKRVGLSGARSGLFMDQVRIIKEMRKNDRKNGRTGIDVRPRFMVWENVPGALSSNGGEDFRAVIEETAKVAEGNARIPRFEGKWPTSGCIMGNGWSIAWRIHDAQFWGVPQRRKRIALVADFGGMSAPEILFERKGLSRDFESGSEERKETTRSIGGGVESAISAITIDPRQQSMVTQEDLAATIGANAYKEPQLVFCLQGNGINRSDTAGCGGRGWREDVSYTLNTVDFPAVFDGSRRHDYQPFTGVCETVQAHYGTGGGNQPIVVGKNPAEFTEGTVFDARRNGDGETVPTLTGDHENRITDYTAIACQKLVRRLTPLECERLQGYPDGWTDIGEWTDSKGKKHKGDSDSPRYKALGNSIALPFWRWMAGKMCRYFDNPTMASLFDGIGGFPLVFSEFGCVPVWASEIEEFPIAVTKIRFPE